MKIILIASGGAAGTILRYLVVNSFQIYRQSVFPWGTFSVNLAGSFLIGMVAGAINGLNEEWRLFLIVGLLGGFTTYSSLALETVNLFRSNHPVVAFTYVVGTNIFGILLAMLGYFLTRSH